MPGEPPAAIRQKSKLYRLYLGWLIAVSTAVRCYVAGSVELGNDEVYYFTYAVQPDWNHFDHPPLVGLFIRLFTLNLHWVNDLTVRLPAISGAALATWLIARSGQLLSNRRTGLIAAVLYTSSLYTSIISGLFILPDSVQLVFWLAALYSVLKLLDSSRPGEENRYVLLFGLFAGLATMCKVHGVFLWLGFVGYVVSYDRRPLKNPYLYISLGLTLLIISPILFWNIENQFVSWQFHSERVEARNSLDLRSFLVATLGQIAYNNPLNVILFVMALSAMFRGKLTYKIPPFRLLLWCSLPIIVATTLVSLLRPTLPHWSGPGFLGLILITAAYIDLKLGTEQNQKFSRLLKASMAIIATVILSGVGVINHYPGTLGNQSKAEMGSGDFTLDMYGWKALRPKFEKIRDEDIRTGRMSANAPLLTNNWFPGGHLYYYIAYPLGMRLLGVGSVNALHKFWWLNSINGTLDAGGDAYFIAPSNYFTNPNALSGFNFGKIGQPLRIAQKRNGRVARYWYIHRLKNAQKFFGGR